MLNSVILPASDSLIYYYYYILKYIIIIQLFLEAFTQELSYSRKPSLLGGGGGGHPYRTPRACLSKFPQKEPR